MPVANETDECALTDCTDTVYLELSSTPEWDTYLREERDHIPIHRNSIPLCQEHYAEYDQLRNADYHEFGYYDEEQQKEITEERTASLDALDLDLVKDPSPFPTDE